MRSLSFPHHASVAWAWLMNPEQLSLWNSKMGSGGGSHVWKASKPHLLASLSSDFGSAQPFFPVKT